MLERRKRIESSEFFLFRLSRSRTFKQTPAKIFRLRNTDKNDNGSRRFLYIFYVDCPSNLFLCFVYDFECFGFVKLTQEWHIFKFFLLQLPNILKI